MISAIAEHFVEHLEEHGKDRIPVSPAAHYTMGGVRTNTYGETTVRGLFAVGEVACTGVHGANRLASNSLLETVVFAKRAVERLFESEAPAAPPEPTDEDCVIAPRAAEAAELRELMWANAGIVRDGVGLTQAAELLAQWETLMPVPTDRSSFEMRSMIVCGRLMTEAALLREESRGAHYRTDFPEPQDGWRRHLVFRR